MTSQWSTLLAVLGPTASGKSALALALAERLGGEIVACDSQQVYIGMDIGTGKPTRDERRQSPHHLLDLVRPDEPFHAARWAALARDAIADIAARGRLPIVVGGTGLYYRALTVGLVRGAAARRGDPRAPPRRGGARWASRPCTRGSRASTPATAAAISPRDLVRISRALEVYEQTGVTVSVAAPRSQHRRPTWRPYAIVLDPPLPELRRRIEARVEAMMAAGFLDEVRALRAAGYGPSVRPMQALGYKQLGAHLDGACTLEAAVATTSPRPWPTRAASGPGFARRRRPRASRPSRRSAARTSRSPRSGARAPRPPPTRGRPRLRLSARSARGRFRPRSCGATIRSAPFSTRAPVFKGHVLVVPRAHVPTLLDLPDGEPGAAVRRRPARRRRRRARAGGRRDLRRDEQQGVSQSVPHLHVHVVPRRRKDGLRGFFWPRVPYASDAEREEFAARIAAALR